MEQTQYKKQLKIFSGVVLGCLLFLVILVVVVDPFFQYHKPIKGVHYIIDNQVNQNAGMAKNFEYDSVILGSSMTVNFDTDIFKETMGLNTLKLSQNAAFPKDIDTMLKIVEKKDEPVKTVFLGVDITRYKAEPGTMAYPIPEYLYDDNILNDVSYIFNKDVLIDYIIKPQVKQETTPVNEIYWTWPYMWYGWEQMIYTGFVSPKEYKEPVPYDFYEENISENLETYILPYIEQMPDTEFVIFFPPYSILYWYEQVGLGTAGAELQGEKQIIEKLLSYPNVRIFYFQNQYDYITGLYNYSDYTHYNHEMNDYMTECFADGTHELTLDNYEAVIDEMMDYVLSFDYKTYWPL